MSTPDKEPIPESELISRMICAQYGTAEQSDLISRHMKDYFAKWPNYYPRLTDLEWYHLFLDFSDAVNWHLSSQQKASPGMRVKDNSGKAFEVHKYIKDAEGVEHIWCNEWYGHHGIGHDCEWASEETPSVHPSAGLRMVNAKERMPKKGQTVAAKVQLEKSVRWFALYVMKHNGRWSDYDKQVIEWLEETPAQPANRVYPEGGGEGEKPASGIGIDYSNTPPLTAYGEWYNGEWREMTKEQFDDKINHLFATPAPEAQPIADNPDVSDINVGDMSQASVNELADGKEVPDHVMEFIGKRALKEAALHFHPIYSPDQNTACVICYTNGGRDIYRATRSEMVGSIQAGQIEASFRDKIIEELKADLLAARDKNNEDAIEIARLQAELKRCQENLTAMIDEALQKSEQLDEARGYFEKIRRGRSTFDMGGYAGTYLAKYPSPTQNSDK